MSGTFVTMEEVDTVESLDAMLVSFYWAEYMRHTDAELDDLIATFDGYEVHARYVARLRAEKGRREALS